MLDERMRKVRLRSAFSSHLAVALKALAVDGKGIAWASRSLVEDELQSGALCLAGGEEWRVTVSVVLVRSRERQSPLAEQFWSLGIRRSS
ncbi:LysR substrate-binding domain-containing protein [Rhizobium leguminosarum]|uniref:LysR substrate-binding domain-containing protein n=1 Tax=Rhizobium leguminosarum TaxID=384 RepID=UPI003F6428BA